MATLRPMSPFKALVGAPQNRSYILVGNLWREKAISRNFSVIANTVVGRRLSPEVDMSAMAKRGRDYERGQTHASAW